MLVLLSVGPPVDKPCIWRPILCHICVATIIRDTNWTRMNATNLIHDSKVASTCKPAIAALAGSILVVLGQRIETYAGVMI